MAISTIQQIETTTVITRGDVRREWRLVKLDEETWVITDKDLTTGKVRVAFSASTESLGSWYKAWQTAKDIYETMYYHARREGWIK